MGYDICPKFYLKHIYILQMSLYGVGYILNMSIQIFEPFVFALVKILQTPFSFMLKLEFFFQKTDVICIY